MELSSKNNMIKELHHSKDDVQDRHRRTVEECDRLRDELTAHAKEISQLQNSLHGKQVSLTETESKAVHLQIDLSKAQRERAFLDNTIQTLEKDLSSRSDEYSRTRLEHSSVKLDLETQNSTLRAQLEELKTQHSTLKVNLASLQEKGDRGTAQVRELEGSKEDMERSFQQEVDEKTKLVDLLKRHLQETSIKLEEAEKNTDAARTRSEEANTSLRTQLASAERGAQELRSSNAQKEQEIESLREQLDAQTQGSSVPTIAEHTEDVSSGTAGSGQLQYDGLSVTDMYSKVVTAERALASEQSKRKEAEVYLNRILKDMETKAPLLARQKQDFQRVLEQNKLITTKMEELQDHNAQLRQDVEMLSQQGRETNAENAAIIASNKDLSAQLQHMLKQKFDSQHERSGHSTFPRSPVATVEDVDSPVGQGGLHGMSGQLLLFKDVPELQSRNEQLVRVVRKLEADQAQLLISVKEQSMGPGGELGGKSLDTLHVALNELKDMKEARSRTEDMVLGLVQQRDMYKTMLDEADAKRDDKTGATPMKSSQVTLSMTPASRHKDVLWKVAQTEEENSLLKVRLEKYRELEKTLNESLEGAKASNGSLRLELAHATGESRFQNERAERLEESLKGLQTNHESSLHRTVELEARLLELQTEVRKMEETAVGAGEELHKAHNATRSAEIALVASAETEKRLEALLEAEKEESRRQASLADSIRRIETGLSQRLEEEKASLQLERDSLSRNLETLRKQLSEKSMTSDQRCKVLEEEIRALRSKEEELVRETATLRETAVREEGSAKAAKDKAVLLEKQYTAAQDKLNSIQGAQTMDAVLVRENEQKTEALEKATAEGASLSAELASVKEQMEAFRKVGSSTEKTLAELKQRNESAEQERAAEVAKLSEASAADKAEIAQLRSNNLSILQTIETSRDEATVAKRALVEATRVHGAALAEAKQVADDAAAHEAQLKADILKYQQLSRADKANYAREQELHTQTQKERRDLEAELDRTTDALAKAQRIETDAQKSLTEAQSALATKTAELDSAKEEADHRVEAAISTRENLLQELQMLTNKLDTPSGTVNSSSSSSAEGAAIENTADEASALNKSIAHLNAIVRGMKTEEEVLRSRLSVADSEIRRRETSLRACEKALEGARAQLKRDSEDRAAASAGGSITPVKVGAATPAATPSSEGEVSRLKSQLSQLKMATESNMYLQTENEGLLTKMKSKEAEVAHANAKLHPLKESIRNLEADKQALIADSTQSAEDCKFWKDKYTRYLSDQGKGLDEDAFRDLEQKVASQTKLIEELRADLAESTAEAAEATKVVLSYREETKAAAEKGEKVAMDTENLQKNVQALQAQLDIKTQELADQMLTNQNIEKTSEKRYLMLKAMKEKFQKEKQEWQEKSNRQEKELEATKKLAATAASSTATTTAATLPATLPASSTAPAQPAVKPTKKEMLAQKRAERLAKAAEAKAAAGAAAESEGTVSLKKRNASEMEAGGTAKVETAPAAKAATLEAGEAVDTTVVSDLGAKHPPATETAAKVPPVLTGEISSKVNLAAATAFFEPNLDEDHVPEVSKKKKKKARPTSTTTTTTIFGTEAIASIPTTLDTPSAGFGDAAGATLAQSKLPNPFATEVPQAPTAEEQNENKKGTEKNAVETAAQAQAVKEVQPSEELSTTEAVTKAAPEATETAATESTEMTVEIVETKKHETPVLVENSETTTELATNAVEAATEVVTAVVTEAAEVEADTLADYDGSMAVAGADGGKETPAYGQMGEGSVWSDVENKKEPSKMTVAENDEAAAEAPAVERNTTPAAVEATSSSASASSAEASAKAAAVAAMKAGMKKAKEANTEVRTGGADQGMTLRDGMHLHDSGAGDYGMELRDGTHLHEPEATTAAAKAYTETEDPATQLKRMKDELKMRQQLKGWKKDQHKKAAASSAGDVGEKSKAAHAVETEEDGSHKRQKVADAEALLASVQPPGVEGERNVVSSAVSDATSATTVAAPTSIFGSFSKTSPFSTAGGKFSGSSSTESKPFSFNVGVKLFTPADSPKDSAEVAAASTTSVTDTTIAAVRTTESEGGGAKTVLAEATLPNPFAKVVPTDATDAGKPGLSLLKNASSSGSLGSAFGTTGTPSPTAAAGKPMFGSLFKAPSNVSLESSGGAEGGATPTSFKPSSSPFMFGSSTSPGSAPPSNSFLSQITAAIGSTGQTTGTADEKIDSAAAVDTTEEYKPAVPAAKSEKKELTLEEKKALRAARFAQPPPPNK